MVDGILQLVPSARVGHVGMYRDPVTHEPHQYYCKFPDDIQSRTCLIVDPMLATRGSLTAAIQFLREAGVRDIRRVTLVSAPEGVRATLDFDPDVRPLHLCARPLPQRPRLHPARTRRRRRPHLRHQVGQGVLGIAAFVAGCSRKRRPCRQSGRNTPALSRNS